MRVLLQRVSDARVEVDGAVTGAIGPGLLLLVGISGRDTGRELDPLAGKIANLRIFEDEGGKMNQSALDRLAAGDDIGILVVSQFTLYGDVRKGRRPGFTDAAPPNVAEPLIDRFCGILGEMGLPVRNGVFGAHMMVTLTNDGPVTIWIDSDDMQRLRRSGTGSTP
jgi:D-tyrosyl-tRNA(Tyr) deacylase